MSLRKEFNKVALGVALFAAALGASGCSQEIGSPNNQDAEIQGSYPERDTLTCSKQKIDSIYIGGSQLEEGGSYKFGEEGARLVIAGDIPDDVTLKVNGGQLVVEGNIGKDVDIRINVPEFTHSESYSCMRYNAALKMTMPSTCYKTVHDGPKAPYNCDDVIEVEGEVAKSADIHSTPGTTQRYNGAQFKVKL